MPKIILTAANYNTREDLTLSVSRLAHLDPDSKDNITIEGTRDDLARLHLSDATIFYGIKCVITDTPSVPLAKTLTPDRGEFHPHKIQ